MSATLPDYLPEKSRELAEVIGLDGYMRLVNAYGGTEIRSGNKSIKGVLTAAQYKKFTWYFKNEKLCIPKLYTREAKIKSQEAKRLSEQGLTRAQVAKKLKVHERTIYNYLGEEDTTQIDLFKPTGKEPTC